MGAQGRPPARDRLRSVIADGRSKCVASVVWPSRINNIDQKLQCPVLEFIWSERASSPAVREARRTYRAELKLPGVVRRHHTVLLPARALEHQQADQYLPGCSPCTSELCDRTALLFDGAVGTR